MHKAQVITSVASDLKATEQSIDAAIAHATALVQSMINGRAELNISAVVGAHSQTKAVEALTSRSAPRPAVVAGPQEQANDHRRMGYGVYASIEEKGQDRPKTTGEHRLRAV